MKANIHMDAVSLLKADHEKVRELFDQFEEAEDSRGKHQIAREAMQELIVHSKIEEEIFYPAVRRATGEAELMDEAVEEHHVVELLIKELQSLSAGEKFEAKFQMLMENVKHHIQEEEGEMLPRAEQVGMNLDQLGEQLAERKRELMAAGEKRAQRRASPRRRKIA